MKIRLEVSGHFLEVEREPMSKARFKALCIVACVLLYIALVSVTGFILGEEVAILASLFGLFGCAGAGAAILCIPEKE